MLFHVATSISFAFIIFLRFDEDKYIGFASNLHKLPWWPFFCYDAKLLIHLIQSKNASPLLDFSSLFDMLS